MLVLSRKTGERLILTDKDTGKHLATFVISRIAGNRATVAVDAPDEVRVCRGEIKPEPRTPRLGNPKGGPDAPEAN